MLASLLLGSSAQSLAQAGDESGQNAYHEAHSAMQAERWGLAIELFDEAQKSVKLIDSATYWKAYALYQNNQNVQAKRLLNQLIKEHPDSRWVDDAHVLLIENGDQGNRAGGDVELDEELRLFTLQQLMMQNPERALPKVFAMLEQAKSRNAKRNAIQLLGLSGNEQAADLLFEFIEKETDHELQQDAIQMLSLRGGGKSQDKLLTLYKQFDNVDTKAAIIQGFIHHDDNRALNQILAQESNPDLSMLLIRMLGIKGETAALKDRYKSAEGDQRRAILEALALAGDAKFLYYVIDNESQSDIRNQAIQSLIMVDDEQMADYLIRLYEKANARDEKDSIAHVLMATGADPTAILRLYQKEKDSAVRASLTGVLMGMGEVDVLRQLYQDSNNRDEQTDIMHQLGAMGASDALMAIYQQAPNAVPMPEFFNALGMTDLSDHRDFLLDQFEAGNHDTKEAVLHALMMQDNTDVMVKLLRQASDPEVKKMIIRTISISNPDALLDAIE